MSRIAIWSCLFLLVACSSGPILLTIPNAKAERPPEGKPRVISDDACGYHLLDFIPLYTNETLQNALRSVQYQANGKYVEEIGVEQHWYYGFIGTVLCTRVLVTVVE